MATQAQNTNVDPEEIAKFEALASRWWDPNSEFKPLHQINPLRLNYINEHCPLKDKKVIDVGCGGGILAESMAVLGAKVTGIDLGEAPLAVARLHAKADDHDIDYQQISAEEMADQHAGSFDVVTCMEMLEHVPEPSSTIAACAKLVKPGGCVFFSTINRTMKAWTFAIVGAEYVLQLLPKGTHEYNKFIKPSELDRWCNDALLSINSFIGMHYNPITQHYWLAPGVDVNYIAVASAPN